MNATQTIEMSAELAEFLTDIDAVSYGRLWLERKTLDDWNPLPKCFEEWFDSYEAEVREVRERAAEAALEKTGDEDVAFEEAEEAVIEFFESLGIDPVYELA